MLLKNSTKDIIAKYNIMKFDQLVEKLLEGTSPLRRLYHYTDISKAVQILTQNKFELTYAKGADASKNPNYKRNFYLSCSTIARGRYATGSEGKFYNKTTHCLLELDASKVSDNYKIVPIDYWYNPNFKSATNMDETEERIVSRDHKIPNAKKYIIAVHLYIAPLRENATEWDKNLRKNDLEDANRIAQSGVDYYIYDDVKKFTLLRREKAHKLESDHQYELSNKYNQSEDSSYRTDKTLMQTIDWLIDSNADIDENVKDRLERNWSWRDLYSTVDAEIHNAKSKMRKTTQGALHKLSEYQRKTKKSLEYIVKDAFERGRPKY